MTFIFRARMRALFLLPLAVLLCLSNPSRGLSQPGPYNASSHGTATLLAPDYLDAISDEGIYRWDQSKFPLKVYIDDNPNVPGYSRAFRTILANSFDAWSTACGYRVGWEQVSDPRQANIVCTWTDKAPELEGGTEAGRTKTYTSYNTETNTGVINRATMTLLTRLPDRELSLPEITKAYLHEVGHAFGLAGHSPNRQDVMTAAINPRQSPQLSPSDVATINRLYSGYPQVQMRALARPAGNQRPSSI